MDKPTQGNVTLADNIKIAYFDQLRDQLDESLSIIDNVKEGSDFINIDGKETHVITYLQKFCLLQRGCILLLLICLGEKKIDYC